MKNRLREVRLAKGLTLLQLAEKVGVGWQTVQRKEVGETSLNDKQADIYAKALGVKPQELFVKESDLPLIPVRGAVEAGYWAAALEWDEEDWYDIAVPEDARYPKARRFALEVRGPSMNLIYPEGSALVCVPLVDIEHEPMPGKRYIIYRRNAADEIEATCKELRTDERGKPWLWPVSSHPEHQTPLAVNGDPNDEIEIYALVILSVRIE